MYIYYYVLPGRDIIQAGAGAPGYTPGARTNRSSAAAADVIVLHVGMVTVKADFNQKQASR